MEIDQAALENLEQALTGVDFSALQYFEELLTENEPAARKIVQNVLDERIPGEEQERLAEPLQPKPYKPRRPPRRQKLVRRQKILLEFDPLFAEKTQEGEDTHGRRFIRWTFNKGLEKDLTPVFMAKIRENVHTSFYIRHNYSYQLHNIEDDTNYRHYRNPHLGSPWINELSEAEAWLSEQEKQRLDPDNTERPTTKWVFVSFMHVEAKVVLDRQPLLGTGPLPDWLRNLAHGKSMVALDTFQDNLCLWRCIAVHRGARPDQSTEAARELARSFFNLTTAPKDCPKTCLGELEKVERHLNKGLIFPDWLGIKVYEPEGGRMR